MKIFRYKVIINNEERIVSIGVKKDTMMLVKVQSGNNIYTSATRYKFTYSILAPMDKDKFKKEIELGKLNKHFNIDYEELAIPDMFVSYGALKAFAFTYCIKAMNDWCNKRGIIAKIKVEDYKIS